MSEKKTKRRDFLFTATTAVGAVGAAAVVWPMIDQMNPDASVKALASTEVDVSSLTPGNTLTVLWRGKPVFIRRRTQEEIDEARKVKMEDLIHPEKDEDRAKNPEWLVMLGVCTHLGCVPLNDKGDYNGGKVIFGTTVYLEDLDTSEKINYKIVGRDEADLKQKLIFFQSPIGRGLIGKNKNDLVEINTPSGVKNFEIKDVKYI